MGTGYGLGRGNAPCESDVPPVLGDVPADNQVGAHWFRFSSRHASGVQFCFGDGSVRTIRFGDSVQPSSTLTSDWALLQQLAGRKDGLNKDASSILE